jgi:hypothetical protein
MTYFDPRIYCKQNLKDKDREELEYWQTVFENVIASASFEIGDESILGRIRKEIIDEFCEELKKELSYAMQDNLVGCITSYGGDIEEVEEPETF